MKKSGISKKEKKNGSENFQGSFIFFYNYCAIFSLLFCLSSFQKQKEEKQKNCISRTRAIATATATATQQNDNEKRQWQATSSSL